MARPRRGLCIGCGAAGIIFIVGTAWFGFSRMKPAAATQRTFEAKKGDLVLDVVESGTITAVRTVDVRPRTGGRVSHLEVDEGNTVTPGQVLATVDPQETQLVVNQFQAQRKSAESRLKEVKIQTNTTISTSNADIRQAEAQLRQAQQDWENQPKITEASIAQSKAGWESAKEDIRLLETSTIPNSIVQADNAVNQAKASLEEADANYKRMQYLVSKGFRAKRDEEVGKAQFDTAKTQYDSAVQSRKILDRQNESQRKAADQRLAQTKAAYDQAVANSYLVQQRKDALESAKAGLAGVRARRNGINRQSETQAAAGIQEIDSRLEDANRQLNETEIKAPINGMVTKRYVQIGDLVTALSGFSSGTPVYQIADLSQLKINLSINEVDVSRLKVGQEVEVTVDAVRGETFHGIVNKIAPASDSSSQAQQQVAPGTATVVKFQVEVYLTNSDRRLKPGMSAKCRIITDRATNVLLMDAEAVGKEMKDGKETYFAMKLSGKKVKDKKTGQLVDETERVPLQVGLQAPTRYEITAGAKEGDKFARAPFGGPKRRDLRMDFGANSDDEEKNKDDQKSKDEKKE